MNNYKYVEALNKQLDRRIKTPFVFRVTSGTMVEIVSPLSPLFGKAGIIASVEPFHYNVWIPDNEKDLTSDDDDAIGELNKVNFNDFKVKNLNII